MTLALLLSFGMALCFVIRGASLAAPLAYTSASWRDLWTVEGTVDRGRYLALGFALMAFKYNLERVVAGLLFHRSWSVLAHYVHAPQLDPQALHGTDARFYGMMTVMTLPFIWSGVALTVRRLRSAGLPPALAVLFFAPYLNLLFFLTLSALPAIEDGSTSHSPFFDRLIPESEVGAAVGTAALGGAVVLLMAQFSSVLMRGYGWGLFLGLPFVLGLTSALVYGHHKPRTMNECLGVALLSVSVGGVVLFAAAVEGVICLAMAAPLAVVLAGMGAIIGYFIQKRHRPARHAATLIVLLLGLPVLMGAESIEGIHEPVLPVVSTVDIDAPAAAVWRNVVSFSELPKPTHWIFQLGFAYPTRATIIGRGVGAVRHCEFTTGPFVEPITVWDEPRLLKFSVTSQPSPMKESSWYPDLHPAHLDDYLVSKGGEFRLEPLPGGRTRLTGTTWYSHSIRPSWYWRPMSDWIIHRIHERVLAHVKMLSEARST